jgi:hypothetical protein
VATTAGVEGREETVASAGVAGGQVG